MLKHKNMRYELYSETLKIYRNEKVIHYGLKISLTPRVDRNESQFCTKWDSMLKEFSLQLMDSLIDFYEKRIPENTQAIADAYGNLTKNIQWTTNDSEELGGNKYNPCRERKSAAGDQREEIRK